MFGLCNPSLYEGDTCTKNITISEKWDNKKYKHTVGQSNVKMY